MSHQRSILLRQCVLGALFLSSISANNPALGYTMTVWGDPYDGWGCIGACGGWDGGGYFDPYHGPDQGDGGGGGGQTGSADDPRNLVLVAKATCTTQPEEREHQAGLAYRVGLGGPSKICPGKNKDIGHCYEITFSDGSVGLYQRSDALCTSSALMIEIRPPGCRP
jgi:hypothetical protein